jgi:hypothetical protein
MDDPSSPSTRYAPRFALRRFEISIHHCSTGQFLFSTDDRYWSYGFSNGWQEYQVRHPCTHLANRSKKCAHIYKDTSKNPFGYLALVVRLLQGWLSSLFNLLFRDPKDPERLWTWGELAVPLVGFGAFFGFLAWLVGY